jgi:hypothetical protein
VFYLFCNGLILSGKLDKGPVKAVGRPKKKKVGEKAIKPDETEKTGEENEDENRQEDGKKKRKMKGKKKKKKRKVGKDETKEIGDEDKDGGHQEDGEKKTEEEKTWFNCEKCKFKGRSLRAVDNHYARKHNAGLRFYCAYCEKSFAHKYSLDMHEAASKSKTLGILTGNHSFTI